MHEQPERNDVSTAGFAREGWRRRSAWEETASGRRAHEGGGVAHNEFWVTVENLAGDVTWWELKDHMRKAGHVTYCRIRDDGRDDSCVGQGCFPHRR